MNLPRFLLPAALASLLALAACDPQRIAELEPGVSTEADVVARFGPPENVWPGPDGERIFEYNRQPEGTQNYMIAIGPDGRMRALRQVLTPDSFRRVQPGMPMEAVRQMLGKPARQIPYDLKREIHWSWRFMDEATQQKQMFHVVFNRDYHVLRTETGPDLDGPDMRGGG